jgi:hypothetical protein
MDRAQRDHFRTRREPTYVSGPYDDPNHVIRTLRRTVACGGFHYTVALDTDELRIAG